MTLQADVNLSLQWKTEFVYLFIVMFNIICAKKKKVRLLGLAAGVLLLAVGALAYNNVSDAVTSTDIRYDNRFLRDAGYSDLITASAARTFQGQVRTILDVQNAVLLRAPINTPIPLDHTRGPEDLYKAMHGLCYDRSRVIENMLRYLGYSVRHLAIYSTKTTGSGIVALLTPGDPSHAITEVKTVRGWMLVDPNTRWIGLTRSDKPVDAAELEKNPKLARRSWDPRVPGKINSIFRTGFIYVFGLYSRHGDFYPPYTVIPDINWREAIYNLTG